jgi:hypothetical protein
MQNTPYQKPIHNFFYTYSLTGTRVPIKVILRWDLGAGWSSPVARQAHNLKVTGSNPVPATILTCRTSKASAFGAFFVSDAKTSIVARSPFTSAWSTPSTGVITTASIRLRMSSCASLRPLSASKPSSRRSDFAAVSLRQTRVKQGGGHLVGAGYHVGLEISLAPTHAIQFVRNERGIDAFEDGRLQSVDARGHVAKLGLPSRRRTRLRPRSASGRGGRFSITSRSIRSDGRRWYRLPKNSVVFRKLGMNRSEGRGRQR